MDADVVRLRNIDGRKWTQIAAVIGRSKTACQARYTRITGPETRIKLYRRTWTSEQDSELYRMRYDDRMPVREIALILKRSAPSIEAKLERMRNPARNKVHFERPHTPVIPRSCLDDRDRRAAADRTITAMLCGDPAPGQSAWDRKQLMGATA